MSNRGTKRQKKRSTSTDSGGMIVADTKLSSTVRLPAMSAISTEGIQHENSLPSSSIPGDEYAIDNGQFRNGNDYECTLDDNNTNNSSTNGSAENTVNGGNLHDYRGVGMSCEHYLIDHGSVTIEGDQLLPLKSCDLPHFSVDSQFNNIDDNNLQKLNVNNSETEYINVEVSVPSNRNENVTHASEQITLDENNVSKSDNTDCEQVDSVCLENASTYVQIGDTPTSRCAILHDESSFLNLPKTKTGSDTQKTITSRRPLRSFKGEYEADKRTHFPEQAFFNTTVPLYKKREEASAPGLKRKQLSQDDVWSKEHKRRNIESSNLIAHYAYAPFQYIKNKIDVTFKSNESSTSDLHASYTADYNNDKSDSIRSWCLIM